MPDEAGFRMHPNLRVMLDFQELFEACRNPFVRRLVPGERYDCAPANAKAGILTRQA
jgi:hypothetical protein